METAVDGWKSVFSPRFFRFCLEFPLFAGVFEELAPSGVFSFLKIGEFFSTNFPQGFPQWLKKC